jgi:putative FmdB family regulatory protein
MPIYEYVCNACGHEFEEWQKISDAPVSKCPTCGKRKVERLVSLSAFHLKGTGWYVTDYAKKDRGSFESKAPKSGGSTDKSDSKSETKSEAKTENKSESKTETKSESKTENKSLNKSEKSS